MMLPVPTMEEVREDFPHASTCTCDRQFDQIGPEGNLEITERYFYGSGTHWGMSMAGWLTYLKCKHCSVSVRANK